MTSKVAAKSKGVLIEIDPRSAVNVLGSPDVIIERGERKWFTPDEARGLLELRHDGRPVLREADPPSEASS